MPADELKRKQNRKEKGLIGKMNGRSRNINLANNLLSLLLGLALLRLQARAARPSFSDFS